MRKCRCAGRQGWRPQGVEHLAYPAVVRNGVGHGQGGAEVVATLAIGVQGAARLSLIDLGMLHVV